MTVDGFGIEHRPTCPRPLWAVVRHRAGGDHYQRCKNCGVAWPPKKEKPRWKKKPVNGSTNSSEKPPKDESASAPTTPPAAPADGHDSSSPTKTDAEREQLDNTRRIVGRTYGIPPTLLHGTTADEIADHAAALLKFAQTPRHEWN
ncbi:hypothetical protein [Brachybacterium epidermidis]|uniref:hypothetical protein n=1 Tax=Brachybacterium epidermidis TaxID=2781983 RepID=UPI00398F83E1